jgi:hypothetical protein
MLRKKQSLATTHWVPKKFNSVANDLQSNEVDESFSLQISRPFFFVSFLSLFPIFFLGRFMFKFIFIARTAKHTIKKHSHNIRKNNRGNPRGSIPKQARSRKMMSVPPTPNTRMNLED